eukprot:g5650.t1
MQLRSLVWALFTLLLLLLVSLVYLNPRQTRLGIDVNGSPIFAAGHLPLWSRGWHTYPFVCHGFPPHYYTWLRTGDKTRYWYMWWYADNFRQCPNNSLIWIRMIDINTFAHAVLPKFEHSFILITTDGDDTIPKSLKEGRKILSHPLLTQWYTQNYGFFESDVSPTFNELRKEKMRLLPIGLDLHTNWPGGIGWKGLIMLRNSSRQISESNKYKVYVDAMSPTHPVRKQLLRSLEKEGCIPNIVRGTARMGQEKVWEAYRSYGFALAPRGNGLDTHRFWEMLFLGTIPVVESSSLDPLYTDLPVLVLRNWTQLCGVNWTYEYSRLSKSPISLPVPDDLMTMPYWFNRAVRTDGPMPSYVESAELHNLTKEKPQPSPPPESLYDR